MTEIIEVMMTNDYIIFETTYGVYGVDEKKNVRRRMRTETRYKCYLFHEFWRGLQKTSMGREIVSAIANSDGIFNIYAAKLTMEEALRIEAGRSIPPTLAERMRQFAMER